MSELDFIEIVSKEDHDHLREKAKSYGDSWKRSGGRSSWFMLKRKMDRLENMLNKYPKDMKEALAHQDVFEKIKQDPSGTDGTVLAEIRDLRRYLLLVESEMMNQKIISPFVFEKDDESLHAKQPELWEDGKGYGFTRTI